MDVTNHDSSPAQSGEYVRSTKGSTSGWRHLREPRQRRALRVPLWAEGFALLALGELAAEMLGVGETPRPEIGHDDRLTADGRMT